MPFTKLDQGILQSSIMAADPVTFKVWIALLAAAGADGMARVAPTYLAAVCHLPTEDVRRALNTLTAPDPDSRTPDNAGRRIERVDGGWQLLNYAKYRRQGSVEAVREYERERKRRQREDVPDSPGRTRDSSASTSLSDVVSVSESVEENNARDLRSPEDQVRGSNFRAAAELDIQILRACREIAGKTGEPAWKVMRRVTSYRKPDGEMSAGVEDPSRLGSVLAREKALEDARAWVAHLDAGGNAA